MAPVPSENARFDSLKQHPIDAVLSLIKLKSKQKPRSQSDPTKDSSCEETVESLLPVNCEYDVQLMKLLQSQSIYKSDIDSLYKSNDNFSRVLCAKNQLNTKSPTKASGIKSLHNSAVKPIMNNSDMPMGDLNNMGLQKSNSEILGQETSLFIKEKSYPNDMEQLLKQLGPDMLPDCNSADGAGDIENVEEIFQAIKNFESNNTSEPMVCGDPGEMDNMVSETNDDNEVIFPMADSADIAGSLSNFFNDVDMMGICVDDNVADIQSGKDAKLKDTLNEMQKRQFHLQRKEEWLKRRMHKMQARQMTKQASEDVVSFLEFASNSSGETASLRPSLNCQNALTSDLKALRKKMPYANTSIFFRRLEQSLKQRHTVPTLKSSVKYFGSGRSSSVSKGVTVVTPKLSAEVRSELERVAGTSLAHLEAVQRALDSDATASSSGAESCDEMQNFNNQHQQHLPIAKRSLWKYVKERALIGSKWVWLQAQIADLQYKIREYDEFLSKVKATKKCVELKPESAASSSSVVINGYHGSLPGAVPGSNKDDDESANHCARTQPFCRSSFSNRKLGRVSDIFKVSKKPIKRSTVMCRCTSSLSCILCAGSVDKPTLAPKQLPDSSLPERIAALDPGFHPILSFSSDVSLSTHLNSLMRVPEWQQGVSRMSIKSYSSRSVDLSSDSVNPEKRLKLAPSVEMFQHRKKLNTLKNSSIHGPGMKKKPGIRGRKPKILKENLGCHSVEKVKAKRVAVRSMDDEQILVSETGSDIHVSPPASPGHNQSASVAKAPDRNEFTRRKRENSYDIDNIVIPYSVAAMTRVEKLPYKEILTPKWRVIEEDYLTDAKNNDVKTPSQDSDCEDISDDAVALRHERCEKEERAKFRSYLIKPSGMSRPRHRRLDNPDSMDFESSSPMTTPPATPQPVIDNFCDQVTLRKRAPSVTKKEKEDVNSPIDCDEQVAPYEPREFPLTEETYKKMLEDNIEIARSLRYTPQYFPITNPDDGSEPSRNASSASSSSGSGDSLNMIPEDMNDPDWTSGLSARRKDKL